MKRKHLLFDFDGVIADSFEQAYEVSSSIIKSLTKDEYRSQFEGNIYDSLEKESQLCTVSEYFEIYSKRMKDVSLIDGIGDLIRRSSNDHELSIVSSSTTEIITNYLIVHDLKKHFLKIAGAEEERCKSKKIKQICQEYEVMPENCLFITDTLGDIREAERSGVRSVAVTWGFHDEERLNKGNPYAVVSTVVELEKAIHAFFYRQAIN
jgi:phosphoglycolate phosphatase